MKKSLAPTVYSTDHGKICPHCSKPVKACVCGQRRTQPGQEGIVRIGRQTKGRKGKGVTIITGVPLQPSDLASLAKELKRRCGSGGTVKEGTIEIQGDHRDVLYLLLSKRGWQVKRCGG